MRIRKLPNKGQSEMVGFVLIVVLVVIALMVFLVISVRQTPEEQNSLMLDNMLESVLSYTTDCAIVFEPKFDSVEDLIKSCHDNERCSNLERSACDYMNESLKGILKDLTEGDNLISAYEFEVFSTEAPSDVLFKEFSGQCNSEVVGAQKVILVGGDSLTVRLRACSS